MLAWRTSEAAQFAAIRLIVLASLEGEADTRILEQTDYRSIAAQRDQLSWDGSVTKLAKSHGSESIRTAHASDFC
jgi:hypothetical protein